MIHDSTLTVQLERAAGAPPLIEQLASFIRREISGARLPSGSRLPSTRALADQLGVSRTVTSEAYAALLAEGYLESRRGAGTFVVERSSSRATSTAVASVVDPAVASAIDAPAREAARSSLEPKCRRRWLHQAVAPAAVDPPADPAVPFRICEPDAASFPDAAWRTAARAAVNEPLDEGYPSPEGDEELRRAIAAFLLRERGLHATAEELILTSGTTQSLDLIARATLSAGDVVAFEDPGYRLARQIFTGRGAMIRPVPVDGGGLVTGELLSLSGDALPMAVYLTPSHQFPLGSALSYRRRLELLEWAACSDVLLVEDDYDGEFRFDGPVLPSLYSSDRAGSVAYLGTFSKSLSPRLRVGYLIAPEPLRSALLRLKVRADHGSSWLPQRALARYLEKGAFDRHLRRMRRLYRRRRDLLVEGLDPLPEGAAWCGLAAGLHATLLLPPRLAAARVVERCRRRGVVVADLASYQVDHPASDPERAVKRNGLVLGYGASDEVQIEKATAVLRRALGDRGE